MKALRAALQWPIHALTRVCRPTECRAPRGPPGNCGRRDDVGLLSCNKRSTQVGGVGNTEGGSGGGAQRLWQVSGLRCPRDFAANTEQLSDTVYLRNCEHQGSAQRGSGGGTMGGASSDCHLICHILGTPGGSAPTHS